MNPSRSELSRRDLLQLGGLGMLGITLPQLLQAETQAKSRPRSCIFIVQYGGAMKWETTTAPVTFLARSVKSASRTSGDIEEHEFPVFRKTTMTQACEDDMKTIKMIKTQFFARFLTFTVMFVAITVVRADEGSDWSKQYHNALDRGLIGVCGHFIQEITA